MRDPLDILIAIVENTIPKIRVLWLPHGTKSEASAGFPLLKGDGRGIEKGDGRGLGIRFSELADDILKCLADAGAD
jgi:hypothetical protein